MTSETPAFDKAGAAAALSPPARRLHRWVLSQFRDSGTAPRRRDMERFTLGHGDNPQLVLAELADHDLVALDAAGELRASYPFSPVPTRTTVTWTDGPTVHAMCAIDALGMSAMLDRPVLITATEPDSDDVVVVEADDDRADWTPETGVVYLGAIDDDCCASVDRTCGWINFFTTEGTAGAWARRNSQVTGRVLDQSTALALAVAEFRDLLR